jgi:hypothetical protein
LRRRSMRPGCARGSDEGTRMATAPLSETEIRRLADDWYHRLDEHAPLEALLALVAPEALEMRFPEAAVRGLDGLRDWYEAAIRAYFDEAHAVRAVKVVAGGERPVVRVVVNWRARRWRPPAPRAEWLDFEAQQTWVIERSANTGQPVIRSYVVDELRPMVGSAAL